MSRHTDSLERVRGNVTEVLRTSKRGTQAQPRTVVLIDLAIERAMAWAEDKPPKGEPGPERGGSSSPREASDRRESAMVKRRALAATRLARNVRLVAKLMADVAADTAFLTTVTDENPDEEGGELPGCRSCARFGENTEVWEKLPGAKAAGLCRFCWEIRDPDGTVPSKPVEWKHDGQRLKLSDWLSKNRPNLSRAQVKAAPQITAGDLELTGNLIVG